MSDSTAAQLRDREAAVVVLFAIHHARLVGLARLLVDDLPTAEDVVQEAFTALYQRWPRLRDPQAAGSYLQSSVLNGARSSLRRRRTMLSLVREKPVPLPSAEQVAVGHETRREVIQSLHQLPGRQREVLVLRYYLDLSEAEIAATLSISRGSVKKHASRALTALSARLEPAQ
ncbi:MAG TPA: SigE family RNA polymerase sigma factor [Acidothermaceae bacterium]|nr:SigE family RNA polymerase sigma factor [Acidothermaceae bacterium]